VTGADPGRVGGAFAGFPFTIRALP
jgi:hypothetical protein